jgi:hypothetical protein
MSRCLGIPIGSIMSRYRVTQFVMPQSNRESISESILIPTIWLIPGECVIMLVGKAHQQSILSAFLDCH